MPGTLVRTLLIACLLLLLPALAPAAPLRVVLDENYPPFSHRNPDRQLEGYTVDLWRLWQEKTGVPVQLMAANWAQVQPMLARGDADVIDPIFLTPARAAQFAFSKPYATVATGIYADASIGGIHNLASLKGFEVAVQAGDACAEQLQRAGVNSLRVFPDYESLIAAAASQSVKLLCMDEYSADYRLYRLGLHRTYVKAFSVAHDELRRAVRKGDSATLVLVERGMAQISEAELAALHDKWMGRPLAASTYTEGLTQALGLLAGLVLLLAVWLASVRRAVRVRTFELAREKAQLRTLVESSPDLIWLKDADGVYRACNSGVEVLIGKPREHILGKTDQDLFDPETAALNRSADLDALAAGTPLRTEQQSPLPGPCHGHTYETLKTPVVKPDGTVLGVLGVARDITERREQETTIREQGRLLEEMSRLAQIAAWEIDLATDAFRWTEELARIYEIPPDLPLTPATCTACYAKEEQRLIGRSLHAAATRGEPFTIELPMVSGAGKRKWVRSICTAVLENGRPVRLRGTVQDVTQRRELEESMRMANLIYQTSLEAIVVTDEENRIVDANPAFTRQTGYPLTDVLGTRPALFGTRMGGQMEDAAFHERLRETLLADDHWEGEILERNMDGSFSARYVDIRVIRHPDGRLHRHVLRVHDLSEQKRKDELIWRQNNFDTLTGLPNRRLFLDRLEQDLKKAHGAGRGLGVLLLDLDRFKEINDSYGHARGDTALVELTRRLAGCVAEDATIARLGGNMFALVVSEFDGRRHLETTADAIIAAMAAPLQLGTDDLIHVSASVGISVFPDDGIDAAELVRNAEQAVYLAKTAGRGRFQYFTPALQQHARAKLMLTRDLRAALARNQLQVYYQPIVEVTTERIRKAETLLRWHHHELGLISPARFIPLAEEIGLIHEIGEWVLNEAIASVERWQREYGFVVELSVNVSPVQFEARSGLPWLERVIRAALPPDSITIEITEGVLVNDAEQMTRCLHSLHGAGAKVSIDDFGTGFSSLSYLTQFDVDYLKIDKSFVDQLTGSGSDKALAEAIVDLAHRLGIKTIAEGVETGAQRDILAGFGCDYIQGYHYSPAVPRAAFEEFLDRQMAH